MTVVLAACNSLQPHHAPALAEQLGKFPALKQVDVSGNPGLRLLPVGMLRIAATLETFKCDGCSLLLPPQSMFSTPEENPRRIQELLSKGSSATVLVLSAAELTPSTAREVAALLPFYPALKQVDVSANPGLRCTGAAIILSALSGMLPLAAHCLLLIVSCDCCCAGAGAAALQVVNVSGAGLVDDEAPALAEQLGKFPALKQVDVSANPGLDLSSVSLIFQALSGKTPTLFISYTFLCSHFLLQRSHVSPGAPEFAELNLGGTGVDSLPDDIAQHTPNLTKLVLDRCVKLSCLPVLLGSLNHLNHVSVKDCTALVHPPTSQRADPSKTVSYLRQLHNNSDTWRRLKVQQPPCLAR